MNFIHYYSSFHELYSLLFFVSSLCFNCCTVCTVLLLESSEIRESNTLVLAVHYIFIKLMIIVIKTLFFLNMTHLIKKPSQHEHQLSIRAYQFRSLFYCKSFLCTRKSNRTILKVILPFSISLSVFQSFFS